MVSKVKARASVDHLGTKGCRESNLAGAGTGKEKLRYLVQQTQLRRSKSRRGKSLFYDSWVMKTDLWHTEYPLYDTGSKDELREELVR